MNDSAFFLNHCGLWVCDSREVVIGSVFVALKGEKVDGHAFLEEAALKGATRAIVNQGYSGPSYGLELIRVENVLEAVQEWARKALVSRKTRVIGVTGSVGKTTTKEFIGGLLEGKYRVYKSPGNANSQITLPLTILNSSGDEEIIVLEMGMSLPGEMERLVRIAPPEVAIVTTIGHAHIEFFNDGIGGIAREKAEIFSHPATRVAIVSDRDCRYLQLSQAGVAARIRLGVDYTLEHINDHQVVISEKGVPSPVITLPFSEKHFIENFLGAVAVVRAFDVSWEDIVARASQLRLYAKRFERIEREGMLYINDSYNASPESMYAALKSLPAPKPGGKRVAVFGEMMELGLFSEQAHLSVAEYALNMIDVCLCYGKGCLPMIPIFEQAKKRARFYTEFASLKEALKKEAAAGDVILIKGSKSNGLWRLLED